MKTLERDTLPFVPVGAWSFYTLLASHVRLCRPALRKGFAFPGLPYSIVVFSARLRLAG
jgi:hypothetical protein